MNWTPSLRIDQKESQLFKLYNASINEVTEIQFVLSCLNELNTFLIELKNNPIATNNDERLMQKIGDKYKLMTKYIS
jgi:hypothetical protein